MRVATLIRALAPVALLTVVQCTSKQTTESAVDEPSIQLSASARSFTATEGGGDPAEQTVDISNAGSGSLSDLTVEVTYAGQATGWMDVALLATTAPTTLRLQPLTGRLDPGTYRATVSVASAMAENGPESIAISFEVTAPPTPVMVITPASLSFTAVAGGTDPAQKTAQLTNGGGGTLNGLSGSVHHQAGEPTGWLSAAMSGTTAPITVWATPMTGALSPGTYHASIRLASPVAGNSPQSLEVIFTVTPPTQTIVLNPTSVSFTGLAGAASPAPKTVQVTSGTATVLTGLASSVTYQAGQATGWLQASLSGTTSPATLTLTPATGVLTAGTYNATVAVTSPVAGNSPQIVGVTFTVTSLGAAPTIGVSDNDLSFTATSGGANPAAQTIQVTNTGGGTLTGLQLAEIPSTTWLTVTPSSTTAPATLSFQVQTGTLSPGTYSTTVNVSSTVATNSPVHINVSLTVQAPLVAPTLQVPTVSGTTVTLTWTYAWSGLGSSSDGYRVESSASPTSGFTELYSVATHESPYTLNITSNPPGTRYYRVRAVTTRGTSPYSTVQSATVGSTARITIRNQLSPGGGDKVLRFRVASSLTQLNNAANTSAERLSAESYCGALPGTSIDPGESMTFDVASFAPNYFIHIGLGDWDNSDGGGGQGCWEKKMWSFDGSNLLYLFVAVQITGQTGPVEYTLLTLANGNLVLRTPTGDIPVVVSVNQDPIR